MTQNTGRSAVDLSDASAEPAASRPLAELAPGELFGFVFTRKDGIFIPTVAEVEARINDGWTIPFSVVGEKSPATTMTEALFVLRADPALAHVCF